MLQFSSVFAMDILESHLLQGLLGTVLFLISIWYFVQKRKGKGSPPGPISLPIVGNVLQIGERPHITFQKWAKKYGPIFKINVAMNDTIILTDPKMIKELFSDLASSGRWTTNPIVTEFTKGPNGIINAEGDTWESQRRFTLKTLRDFGYLKSAMEDLIVSEVHTMIKWFKKREGAPITGNRIFNAPVANSLWHLVSGERCNWEDSKPYIHEAMDDFMIGVKEASSSGLLFAPFLRHIAPDFFGWTKYHNSVDKMINIFKKTVKEHEKELNPSNLKDYIDHHLLQIKETTDPNSSFYKDVGHKNLLGGIFDLFFAGSETTSHTLSWVLLFLSHDQEVQKKLHSEINQIVGTSRLPSLADRSMMPYTEAVLSEVLRLSTVLALGVMHSILTPKLFHGYTFEKGTIIFANLFAIHRDPKIWGDSETFRPERFLNEDETKVIRHEALVPFSEGKRKCMGEGFARDTLFLFTTAIFQNFQVNPDPESTSPPDFEADLGYFLVPKPFKVVMTQREGVSTA